MSTSHHRRDHCQLCGGSALTLILSLAPTPPANAFVPESALNEPQERFPLDVFHCEDCHHTQLTDVVDPAVLFENYVYVSGTSPSFVRHFEEYANTVIDRFGPASGSLVVDIGSNDGTLLKFFKDEGHPVLGIDPAKDIAAAATSQLPSAARISRHSSIRPASRCDAATASAISQGGRDTQLTTLDEVDVLSATLQHWYEWMEQYPVIRRAVEEYAAAQIQHLSDLAAELALDDTLTRLVHMILRYSDTDKHPQHCNLIKDLSQEELAQMIGTVRPVLARLIGQLKREKLIEVNHGEMRVLNHQGLLEKIN